ncbi:TPA: exodeoxyribonuclease VII small subunit [Acinetobacter baumannii]
MTKKELTFKDGYEILKKNAELLESQKEPDIDNLMKIVEESMTAYKACKSRVDAVQRALNETFNEEIKIQSADVKL